MEVPNWRYIQDDLIGASDEKMISGYLMKMIHGEGIWPDHFLEDADVYNKNPRMEFDPEDPIFVIVNPKTEACGVTDGCESGCWRITGRDKPIESTQTGKTVGFKRILWFLQEIKPPREYKRSWIMEEYRVLNRWKKNHVICKIRLMFGDEIISLLAKHFYDTLIPPAKQLFLPDYGVSEEGAYYLQTILESDGNKWPSYVTNDVYGLDPFTLVDPQDENFLDDGVCFFANRTETSGRTDQGCDGGCWRIMKRDKLIKIEKLRGFKRVFKFCAREDKYNFVYKFEDEDLKVTWTMEEIRLAEKKKQDKVVCIIKFTVPIRKAK